MGFWEAMRGLNQRCLVPEIMDDPALAPAEHFEALHGLERINRLSRSARLIWNTLKPLFSESHQQPIRLLDIASGAGDIPITLSKFAERVGAPLEIEACDCSARAVEFAAQRAAAVKANVKFYAGNPVAQGVPEGYDVIVSSLFFHHLETAEATELLRGMGRQAKWLVVVNDLARSRRGYFLACAATRLLSTSRVVRFDGPQSVRAAFSVPEMRQMANAAGLKDARIERKFPCRFVLSWRR